MTKHLQEESWDDIQKACQEIVTQIKNARCEVYQIVAVRKGGIIPAGMLLQEFPGAGFHIINVVSYDALGHKGKPEIIDGIPSWLNTPFTLVVDEICDSGDTFEKIREHLPVAMYAALHVRAGCKFNPEFWGKCVEKGKWICYPWEPPAEEVEIPF